MPPLHPPQPARRLRDRSHARRQRQRRRPRRAGHRDDHRAQQLGGRHQAAADQGTAGGPAGHRAGKRPGSNPPSHPRSSTLSLSHQPSHPNSYPLLTIISSYLYPSTLPLIFTHPLPQNTHNPSHPTAPGGAHPGGQRGRRDPGGDARAHGTHGGAAAVLPHTGRYNTTDIYYTTLAHSSPFLF